MKHKIRIFIAAIFLFLPAVISFSETTRKTVLIPIKGDIEPSLGAFVRRQARSALSEGAEFLIFEIDTFGGRVDTALQISSFIGSIKDAKTIAWVRIGPESLGVSWSAGALIALSCNEIYMAPGTSIGAAAPVTMSSTGETKKADEKTVSAVRSQMAALAEKNDYPVALALAMVDEDVEVWEVQIGKERRVLTSQEVERLEQEKNRLVTRIGIVSPKGKLLSLTAGEAVRYGLARGIEDDSTSLVQTIGAEGPLSERTPGFADTLVSILTSSTVQTLLILIGLIMLFLEINTPGFGVPGVIAIIAFLVIFGSNALLGTVGSLEMLLFLLGVGLLAVEIFLIPGFGITGICGIVLIGLSLVLSMQDFAIPTLPWQWELFGKNLVIVAVAVILALAGIAVIILMGTKIKTFDWLTLKTKLVGTAAGSEPENETIKNYSSLIGKQGTTISILRPSGKALIDDQVYVVEADGAFIQQGTKIEVCRVRGNIIVVRSVDK